MGNLLSLAAPWKQRSSTSSPSPIEDKIPIDVTPRKTLTSSPSFNVTQSTTTSLETFSSSSALFAVVNRIAEAESAVIWRLFRKSTIQDEENRDEVFVHPALSVWNKPNPFYTQSEFIEASQQHFELAGEHPWVVARARTRPVRGLPVELWPIRPDMIRPIPHPTKFISGFEYLGDPSGQPIFLRTNEVIVTKRPSPISPYRGASPVLSLLFDLYGEKAAAKYNAMFFDNGAEPGGLIEYPEHLEDHEYRQVVERHREQHQGVNNAHRVGIIEGGKWVDRKYTNRDMQFTELRHFSQEAIRRAYAFPKPLLGDVDDVNRANAEAASVLFSEQIVVSRARRLRDTLNTRFLPLFGEVSRDVEFDFDNPTPPNRDDDRYDATAAVERVKILIELGFDEAEVLEHEGLPVFTRRINTTELAAKQQEKSTSGVSEATGDTDNDEEADKDKDSDVEDVENKLKNKKNKLNRLNGNQNGNQNGKLIGELSNV